MSKRTKHDKWISLALEVSKDSTCLRRQYGAVIVKDDKLISSGYNGAASGCTECTDVGKCYRMENNIPHGKEYESCQSVHAEMNAIIQAGNRANGAILFLAGTENGEEIPNPSCCIMCERFCRNAHIKHVITKTQIFTFGINGSVRVSSLNKMEDSEYGIFID